MFPEVRVGCCVKLRELSQNGLKIKIQYRNQKLRDKTGNQRPKPVSEEKDKVLENPWEKEALELCWVFSM